jgi:hypothetical protein
MIQDSWVTAGRFLTYEEVSQIKTALQAERIPFIVNEHGAHSRYGSYYFEIKVAYKDLSRARSILKLVAQHKSRNLMCSHCKKSTSMIEVKNKTFFQRIYFAGTKLMRCKRCKKLNSI